jgi:hypothetical protein
MLFKAVIAVYAENHTKHIKRKAASLTVKADGTYSYRSALKCQGKYRETSGKAVPGPRLKPRDSEQDTKQVRRSVCEVQNLPQNSTFCWSMRSVKTGLKIPDIDERVHRFIGSTNKFCLKSDLSIRLEEMKTPKLLSLKISVSDYHHRISSRCAHAKWISISVSYMSTK